VKFPEWFFENPLWNSRFVILAAVLGSLFAGLAIFYMATVDVVFLVHHALHYADADMAAEARKVLHDSTVSHIVEVVDGYLLATVLLIFLLDYMNCSSATSTRRTKERRLPARYW